MPELVNYHAPCPCGKSSDAYSEWDDGHGYCFSCSKYFELDMSESLTEGPGEPKPKPSTPTPKRPFTLQVGPYRGFQETTIRKYGCQLRIGEDGTPFAIQYPYGEGLKVRTFPKEFHQEGVCKDQGLFGAGLWESGAAKAVTIVEGEDDAFAAYEMLGSKYPVVSVQSSSTAKRDVLTSYQWLAGFEKIYLALYNDPQGQKATEQITKLFDYNKLYHVKFNKFKDADEYHKNDAAKDFVGAWWAASRYVPEGVVSSFSAVDEVLDGRSLEPIASYPFPTLQDMSYGVRQSEVVLITAESGVGKTEFVRAIEHHLIKNYDYPIGIIHLEEEKERAIKGLVGYEMQRPIHLPGFEMDVQRIKDGWRNLVRTDNRVHLYSHFGADDPDVILDTIRFMSGAAECRFIFLDHITMLVTGLETDDERRKLDYLSTKLGTMARELDHTLFLVSHVNSEGGTHGSKNIHRISDIRIHLERDLMASDPAVRDRVGLTVLKNRYGSKTGSAGHLVFNPETFVLTETETVPRGTSLPPI